MTERAPAPTPASSSSFSVTVSAPAKINLTLRVLDRRPDGYHNLWSIMQTVGLEDEVRIRLAPDIQGIHLRCDSPQLAVDPSNLVCKAGAAVLDRAQKQQVGVDIVLKKRIPMGAGLGGGSSDAAATIVGLNHLLQLGWSTAQMAGVGQPLGSDVPFFLYAPSALVAGRGETVKPVTIDGARWVVMVNPGFGIETTWAYRQLASTREGVQPLSPCHRELDRQSHMNWPQLAAAAENDFEASVFAKHRLLRDIKQNLLTWGAEIALLSGSGATVFGLFEEESAARRAQAHFNGDKQLKTYVVPTGSGPLTVREHVGDRSFAWLTRAGPFR